MLDRHGDRTCPRPNVEQRAPSWQIRKRHFDQRLRLGARHQCARIALEHDVVKPNRAEDVGDRLEVGAATQQWTNPIELVGCHRAIVVQVELKSIETEHAPDQALCVEACSRNPLGIQKRRRQREHVLDRAHTTRERLSHRRDSTPLPPAADDSSQPARRW